MSSRNEPAFPTQMWDVEDEKVTWLDGGLTKREFIATMAMQGLIHDHNLHGLIDSDRGDGKRLTRFELIARWATLHADALLVALEKEQS